MTGAPLLCFISKLRRITGHFYRTFLFLSSEMLLVQSHDQPLHFSRTTNKTTTVLQERNLSSQYLAMTKASSKYREQKCSYLGLICAHSSLSPSHPSWGCWVLRVLAGQKCVLSTDLRESVNWKSWNCISCFWHWFLWKVPASREGAEMFS